MQKISEETKAKMAMQMAILDAIELGHTDPKEMAEFVKSKTFFRAVQRYIILIENNF